MKQFGSGNFWTTVCGLVMVWQINLEQSGAQDLGLALFSEVEKPTQDYE